jgi:RNA polymerase sigma-70 factor, ECF subfamily
MHTLIQTHAPGCEPDRASASRREANAGSEARLALPRERTFVSGLRPKFTPHASKNLVASKRSWFVVGPRLPGADEIRQRTTTDDAFVFPAMSAAKPTSAVRTVVNELVAELQLKAGSEKFGLTQDAFAEILCEIGEKHGQAASGHELRTLFLSLRIDELVLARACAAGHNSAWEVFLTRFREKLYQSALRIAREESAARELADTLYADLYGTNLRDGERVSKLSSYTGRGSLEGWLRTVLAQEYVNRYRRTKRLVSLDGESEEGTQFSAPPADPVPPADPRLEQATDEALAALPAEDRTVLAAYYLDGRTLAEIARMLSVHESTISRKLDKLAKAVRKQILAGLTRRGMSRRQAEEALETDVRDLRLDIRRSLAQDSAPAAFSEKTVRARVREDPG